MSNTESFWERIDPQAYKQGYNAAKAGKPISSCDFIGSGPRASWINGYTDAKKEHKEEKS